MSNTPVSPYGFHKKMAEELCLSYHRNFGLEIGIIRYFSIYGEGLKKQLLWDACRKIKQSNSVTFFGTGKETRDWIHVTDAVNLLYLFTTKLSGYQVINGGSGTKTEINQVIAMLSNFFDKDLEIQFNGMVKEGDPIYFWADTSKSKELGWEPKVKLLDGLKGYVEFYKSLK